MSLIQSCYACDLLISLDTLSSVHSSSNIIIFLHSTCLLPACSLLLWIFCSSFGNAKGYLIQVARCLDACWQKRVQARTNRRPGPRARVTRSSIQNLWQPSWDGLSIALYYHCHGLRTFFYYHRLVVLSQHQVRSRQVSVDDIYSMHSCQGNADLFSEFCCIQC